MFIMMYPLVLENTSHFNRRREENTSVLFLTLANDLCDVCTVLYDNNTNVNEIWTDGTVPLWHAYPEVIIVSLTIIIKFQQKKKMVQHP